MVPGLAPSVQGAGKGVGTSLPSHTRLEVAEGKFIPKDSLVLPPHVSSPSQTDLAGSSREPLGFPAL